MNVKKNLIDYFHHLGFKSFYSIKQTELCIQENDSTYNLKDALDLCEQVSVIMMQPKGVFFVFLYCEQTLLQKH